MHRLFILAVLLLTFSISIFADEKPAENNKQTPAVSTAPQDFESQMKNLENQRRLLSMKIYQTRVKLISEDSELLLMHNQIMKLHKQLAIELNSNDEMKSLLEQSRKLDDQIKNLIDTKNNPQKTSEVINPEIKTNIDKTTNSDTSKK